jgi:hypothetical protein
VRVGWIIGGVPVDQDVAVWCPMRSDRDRLRSLEGQFILNL